MSYSNKFLSAGDINLTDGNAYIYAAKLGAKNLASNVNDTVKVDGAGNLYNAAITGNDISGVLLNPVTENINGGGFEFVDISKLSLGTTTTGTETLLVLGDAVIQGNLNITGSLQTESLNITNELTVETLNVTQNITMNANPFVINTNDGDKIKLTNIASGSRISHNSSWDTQIKSGNSGSNTGIITLHTATASGGGYAERLRLTQAGNVGIGITNPAYKLDVSGSANITGDLTVDTLMVEKNIGLDFFTTGVELENCADYSEDLSSTYQLAKVNLNPNINGPNGITNSANEFKIINTGFILANRVNATVLTETLYYVSFWGKSSTPLSINCDVGDGSSFISSFTTEWTKFSGTSLTTAIPKAWIDFSMTGAINDTYSIWGIQINSLPNKPYVKTTGVAQTSYNGTQVSNKLTFSDLVGITGDIANLSVDVLDVTGSANITGDLTVDTDTLFVDSVNNRVGINKTDPNTALDVVGTVLVSSNLTAGSITSTTSVITQDLNVSGTSTTNDLSVTENIQTDFFSHGKSLSNLMKVSEDLRNNAAVTIQPKVALIGQTTPPNGVPGTISANLWEVQNTNFELALRVEASVIATTTYYFTFWAKSSTNNTIIVDIGGGVGEVFVLTPTWNKYTRSITSGSNAWVDFTLQGVPTDVFSIWGLQLNSEEDEPYTRTTNGSISNYNGTEINNQLSAPLLKLYAEGRTIQHIGVSHCYSEYYPAGITGGRKAYIGYGSAGSTNLVINNNYDSGGIILNPTGNSINLGGNTNNVNYTLTGTTGVFDKMHTTERLLPAKLNVTTRNSLSDLVGGEIIYNTDTESINIYNNTESSWLNMSNGGYMGDIYIGTTGTTTLSNNDTWTRVTGTCTDGVGNNFVINGASTHIELKYTGELSKIGHFGLSWSYKAANTNATYLFGIAKNASFNGSNEIVSAGDIISSSILELTSKSSSEYNSSAIHFMDNIITNDVFTFCVRGDANNIDLDVDHLNFFGMTM